MPNSCQENPGLFFKLQVKYKILGFAATKWKQNKKHLLDVLFHLYL